MAGQKQARKPAATVTPAGSRGRPAAAAPAAATRTKGGKAAAGKAQSRAARARAAGPVSQPEPATGSAASRLRVQAPPDLPDPPRWLQWSTFVLSLAAAAISVYLIIAELQPQLLLCPSTSFVNCANVLHSGESRIAGIPVAVFGLVFYLAMSVLNSPWAWRRRELIVRRARLASFVIGMCFVLYLIYAELILIGNICIWCTSVHIITFVLFGLIVFDSVFRQAPASRTAPAAGAAARR
jgi:uncharacterized membrane protein